MAEEPWSATTAVVAERAARQAVQLGIAGAVLVSLGMSAYAPAVGIELVAGDLALIAVAAGAVVLAASALQSRRVIQEARKESSP